MKIVIAGWIVGFIVLVSWTGNQGRMWLAFVAMAVIGFAAVTLHEAGHVLGGWATGARLSVFSVWPIQLRLDPFALGRMRRANEGDIGGYVRMIYDRPTWRRWVWMIAGGPVANIAAALMLAVWASHYPAYTAWWAIGWAAAVVSVTLGGANLLPFQCRRGVPLKSSDGAWLRLAWQLHLRDRQRRQRRLRCLATSGLPSKPLGL
ncbi:hypothetical protein M9979_15720 [Sphingomonas sp. RP10(2022)]|uniref:Peptidase M50 domain-containing protein n=1 Tax=Sphingomonas liriopis TaxID=2949094 RepID=A0A9X2KRR1_9SPHN|nr:site-2 protease family protein [Sphingomonas liriopis]MCP3736317.1 hypothetical protein [Sphingomonas liriopis]